MNRGAGHLPTFLLQSDGATFERLLADGHARFGVDVHAYCLMSNHFHLLLHCPDGGLSLFMQHLSANYTRAFNERHRRDGPLFRGRFHSILAQDERYVLTAARYIHRNPRDIRPVIDLGDYRWSSHGAYLGRRHCPPWLRTDHIMGVFGGDLDAYDEMVALDGTPQAATIPPAHVLDFLDLAAAEQSVGEVGGSARIARTVAAALLLHVDADTGAAIERALDFRDRRSRTSALRKARRRVDASAELSALVGRIHRRAA